MGVACSSSNPACLQYADVVAGELCPRQTCGVTGVVGRDGNVSQVVIDDHFHAVLGHEAILLHDGLKFHVPMATDRFATTWLVVMVASHHTLAFWTLPYL
jgi:hypothetical protein